MFTKQPCIVLYFINNYLTYVLRRHVGRKFKHVQTLQRMHEYS